MNRKPVIYIFLIFIFLLLISSLIFSADTNSSSCTVSGGACTIQIDSNTVNSGSVFPTVPTSINTTSDNLVCGVYFSAIGCPHCAKIDPILFKEVIPKNPNVVIIEYEVRNKRDNAIFAVDYDNIYKSGFDTPFLVLNKDNVYYYTSIFQLKLSIVTLLVTCCI